MAVRLSASVVLLVCLMAPGIALAQDTPKGRTAEPTRAAPPYETARTAPLEAQDKLVSEADDHTQFRVEFNGIKGDRVPAFLYVPKRQKDDAKSPAILLQYGTGGNKKTDYIVA